jgi:hypothetical protein
MKPEVAAATGRCVLFVICRSLRSVRLIRHGRQQGVGSTALPGVDLTLWLRIAAALVVISVVAMAVLLVA